MAKKNKVLTLTDLIDITKHEEKLREIYLDFLGHGIVEDKEAKEIIERVAKKLSKSIAQENKRIFQEGIITYNSRYTSFTTEPK